MLTIYKGNQVAVIPSGSYKIMFKPYGWTTEKLGGFSEGDGPTKDTEHPVRPSLGDDHSRGNKTTLENMSEQELRQYASLVKVNVRGLKTREELLKALSGRE